MGKVSGSLGPSCKLKSRGIYVSQRYMKMNLDIVHCHQPYQPSRTQPSPGMASFPLRVFPQFATLAHCCATQLSKRCCRSCCSDDSDGSACPLPPAWQATPSEMFDEEACFLPSANISGTASLLEYTDSQLNLTHTSCKPFKQGSLLNQLTPKSCGIRYNGL